MLWSDTSLAVGQANLNTSKHGASADFQPWIYGYPHKLIVLQRADLSQRVAGWEECKADWSAWKICCEPRTATLGPLCDRSPFLWPDVYETFLESFQHEGLITDAMVQNSRRMMTNMCTSLATEISFQNIEDQTRQSKNKRVSSATLWRTPARRKELSKTFNYSEVSHLDVPDTESVKAHLPESLYKVQYKRVSLDFKSIVGTGPPKHPSFNYESFCDLVAAQKFMRHVAENNKVGQAADAWRTDFFHKHSIYRKKHSTKLQMVMSIQIVNATRFSPRPEGSLRGRVAGKSTGRSGCHRVWDWFEVGLISVWDRFKVGLGSVWDRFGIGL